MTLRKKLLKYFLAFQVLLLIPGCILIINSFFDGEDALQKTLLITEANTFIKNYQQDSSLSPPQSATFSAYIGTSNIPEKYIPLLENLPAGVHEIETEGLPNFTNEEEFRIIIRKNNSTTFYFISKISDKESEKTLLNKLYVSIILYIFIFLFSGLLLASIFSKKIANPLEKMAEKISSTKENEVNTSLNEDHYDTEIACLAEAIEQKNRRIKYFISREKNTMRNISHELRTPITVIKSSLELLKSKQAEKPSPYEQKIINKIERSSRDLESMIEAFLWLGREDKEKNSQRMNASECIKKAINDHLHLIKGKTIDISLNIENNITLQCKPPIFYIATANLIRNAFNFTEEGTIVITLMSNIFSVKDSGTGIEDNIIAKIKDTDVKGLESTGFGFGLDIVERVCNEMGWCFNIEKNHNGPGTIALISFN
ncbi:MAG: sensor histidine kinase [Cellvibrionaceae bacterium]